MKDSDSGMKVPPPAPYSMEYRDWLWQALFLQYLAITDVMFGVCGSPGMCSPGGGDSLLLGGKV